MKLAYWGIVIGLVGAAVSSVGIFGVTLLAINGVITPPAVVVMNAAFGVFLASCALSLVSMAVEIFDIDDAINDVINNFKNSKYTKEKNQTYINEYKKEFNAEKLAELEKAIKLNSIAKKITLNNKISTKEQSNSIISGTSSTLFIQPFIKTESDVNSDPISSPGLTS